MKFDWKKAFRAIMVTIFILLFVGGPMFIGFVIASLGLLPIYVIKGLPWVGVPLLVALVLTSIGYLNGKWIKRVWLAFGAFCIGTLVYIGVGAYQSTIPTVDDRDLLLYEYEPFSEGSKAVWLDEEATLKLTQEERLRLRLDGATALYPVYAAFVQATFPEDEYSRFTSVGDGLGKVACSNTVNAYERLILGQTDMIFVAGPSEEQQAMAKKAGMELHLTPIGREAFVFFVNSKNPVTGLTVEQIRGIYTGEITNWRDVGGKNQKIRPFQRAENSGSQTALQTLMAGLPLMEPEKEDRIGAMDGIIRAVASYRNYKNAIGFSFRFYASEMLANDEIRLLALNGVEPTKETIRDGTYPIASEFYAVTAAPIGEPAPWEKNEVMAKFLEWILSEQGQEIIEKTGYVSLQ